MIILGAVLGTLLFGWLFLAAGALGLMALAGFDEQNIPIGLGLWGFALVDAFVWWFLIGQHIHIGVSFG